MPTLVMCVFEYDPAVGVRALLARFVVEIGPTHATSRPPQTVPGARGVEVGGARTTPPNGNDGDRRRAPSSPWALGSMCR